MIIRKKYKNTLPRFLNSYLRRFCVENKIAKRFYYDLVDDLNIRLRLDGDERDFKKELGIFLYCLEEYTMGRYKRKEKEIDQSSDYYKEIKFQYSNQVEGPIRIYPRVYPYFSYKENKWRFYLHTKKK